MRSVLLIILISILNLCLGFSQTKTEIDSLLDEVSNIDDSKSITNTEQAERIIDFKENALPILAQFFVDSTLTIVKSECQERKLTKGEIAIIIADRIEMMPYATITGVQNCLMTFCDGNPNLIEYYLLAIDEDGVEIFYQKYIDWLSSDERIEWKYFIGNLTKKEMKKEIRKRRKGKSNYTSR